jgi:hypothetical protein
MPDDPEEVADFGPIITVRYDLDEARIIYDVSEVDPWSAVAILRQVADTVAASLPMPRGADETVDDDED